MNNGMVRINRSHPQYFELDGKPFVPVGINLCFPRFLTEETAVLDYYRKHIGVLAANGGNFIRIWLGAPFFELETEREGQFEPVRLRHIEAVVATAQAAGVKIKFTLEHFRTMDPTAQAEVFPGAAGFVKSVYSRAHGGSFENIAEFMTADAGKRAFLNKLDFLAERFADSPAIMAWELWNEVNCTGPIAQWSLWTEEMLPELKERFPHHLVLQSLGSFDNSRSGKAYDWLATVSGNDCVQAHRYLDPGAELEICRGPVDRLCADAIEELRRRCSDRPVILAEAGAVEWRHSRPSHLYAADSQGTILHDVLFAPFFAGAAGPGQIWHWEESTIPHNLWWHLRRFGNAIEGIDPGEEEFRPAMREQHHVRFYILEGIRHTLIWCRDMNNTWEAELEHGQRPEILSSIRLDLGMFTRRPVAKAEYYLPWTDSSGMLSPTGNRITLPDFTRSLVIRLQTTRESK